MTHNYTLEAVFTAPDYYWMSSINSYNGPVSDPENLTGCQNDGAFAVLQGNATQQQFGWIVGVLNAAATGHIYVYGYRCEGWDGQLSVYVSANGNDWNCVSDLYINNTWLDWVDCGVSTVPFSYVRLTSEDSEMTSCVCLDCVRVNLLVYNYTLTVSCGENGVTDPSAGTYESIMEGTPVEVTAEADSGYVFDYWLLDGNSSAQNPITVTMYCNHTLQANFRVAQYYDLTISSGSGGSTDPSPDTYEDIMEGTPVEVTANADTGFLFDHWLLDENYYAQNPISVVMNGNHALEAVFVEDPDYYWLSVEAVDLVCENEVYPDVYVDYEYVGAAPLSVRVLDGNVVVEVDEYAWCSHCERDCLLYFITYGEYYGQYYGEFFSNVVEIPIESDTSVWAVYLSQYKR
jgi:hypothetical protein